MDMFHFFLLLTKDLGYHCFTNNSILQGLWKCFIRLSEHVSQVSITRGLWKSISQLGISHISLKQMDVFSLCGIFECVSQVQNGWSGFHFLWTQCTIYVTLCFTNNSIMHGILDHVSKFAKLFSKSSECFHNLPLTLILSGCFTSAIKIVIYKEFNNAWDIGLCFARWPWNTSIVSLCGACFTLVWNEWRLFQ
jgi:hypothetical protein